MSEHHRLPGSRLPADPSYWSDLASRVDAHVSGELARRRRPAEKVPVWWARPDVSPALAVLALIVAGAAWWFVPSSGVAAEDASVVARALQPSDPLAESLLQAGEPDMANLIRRASSGGTPEED